MRRGGPSQFKRCKRKKEIKKQNRIERRRWKDHKKKETSGKTCVKWIEVTKAVHSWLHLEESRDSRKRTI
jgi:hypothetical protein